MPRIRSLKYEYFINEDLAQTSSDARLLGLGLTTIADREGRLEDRPLRIKVRLFPYHDVDVDAALNELQRAGFLDRYEVEGRRFIRIINFLKHQKPHPKEAPSEIPSHEITRQGREIKRKGKPRNADSESQGKPSQVVNGHMGSGLGDLGSSVNGNGHGDSVGTGASATGTAPPFKSTTEFTIWSLGAGKLVSSSHMEPQDAKSFLGAQVKTYGKDAVAECVTRMLAQEPADPKAYLVGVLKGLNSTRAGTSKVEKSMAAVNQYIQEHEAHEH